MNLVVPAFRVPHLFEQGDFTLHTGQSSRWKINCDALTADDIDTLATMLVAILPEFGRVEGVPRGGLRIANALAPYIADSKRLLIVDDVFTTGASLEAHRNGRDAMGAVIFARSRILLPPWVQPLFVMPGRVLVR